MHTSIQLISAIPQATLQHMRAKVPKHRALRVALSPMEGFEGERA
jgi:hypothetical protein